MSDTTGSTGSGTGDGTGDVRDMPADAGRPTVFMFQPSRLDVISSDRFAEWEQHLRDRLGVDLGGLQVTATGTFCGDQQCLDGSDYIPITVGE